MDRSACAVAVTALARSKSSLVGLLSSAGGFPVGAMRTCEWFVCGPVLPAVTWKLIVELLVGVPVVPIVDVVVQVRVGAAKLHVQPGATTEPLTKAVVAVRPEMSSVTVIVSPAGEAAVPTF